MSVDGPNRETRFNNCHPRYHSCTTYQKPGTHESVPNLCQYQAPSWDIKKIQPFNNYDYSKKSVKPRGVKRARLLCLPEFLGKPFVVIKPEVNLELHFIMAGQPIKGLITHWCPLTRPAIKALFLGEVRGDVRGGRLTRPAIISKSLEVSACHFPEVGLIFSLASATC